MIRRQAAVAGAVALGAFALTGCEKPTELVTVVSGSNSIHTEAKCEGKNFRESAAARVAANPNDLVTVIDECLQKKPKTLKVSEGEIVNVGVEPGIDDRWRIVYSLPGDDGEYRESGLIQDQTYAKALTVPNGVFADSDEVPLGVVTFDKDDNLKAVWAFKLEKK